MCKYANNMTSSAPARPAKKILNLDDDEDEPIVGGEFDVVEVERRVREMLSGVANLDKVTLRTARDMLTDRYGYSFSTSATRDAANTIIKAVVIELAERPPAPMAVDPTPPAVPKPAAPPSAPKVSPFFTFDDDDAEAVYADSTPLPAKKAAPKAAPSPSRSKPAAPLSGPPAVSFAPTRDELASKEIDGDKAAKQPSPAKAVKAPPLAGPAPSIAGGAEPPKPDRDAQVSRKPSAPKRTAPSAEVRGGGEIGAILRGMDSAMAAALERLDDEQPSDTMLVELHLKLTAAHTQLVRAFAQNRVRSALSERTSAAPRKPAAKRPAKPAAAIVTPSPTAVAAAPPADVEEGWYPIESEIGGDDAQLARVVIRAAKAKIADMAELFETDAPELLREQADLLEAEANTTVPPILEHLYALSRSVPIKEMDAKAQLIYPVEAGKLFGVAQSSASKLIESTAELPSLAGGRVVAMCSSATGLRNVYAVVAVAGEPGYRLMHLAQGLNPWSDTGFRSFVADQSVISIAIADTPGSDKIVVNILYETATTPFKVQKVTLDSQSRYNASIKSLIGDVGIKLGGVRLAGATLGGSNSVLYAQLEGDTITMAQFDIPSTAPKTTASGNSSIGEFSIGQLNTQDVRPVVVASRRYVAAIIADVSPDFQNAAASAVLAKSVYYLGVRVLMWRLVPGSTQLQIVAATNLVVEGLRETMAGQIGELPCCLSDDGTLLFAIGARGSPIVQPTRIYSVRAYQTGANLVYEGEPTTEISETTLLSGQTGQLLVAHTDGEIRELVPSYAPRDFAWQLSA